MCALLLLACTDTDYRAAEGSAAACDDDAVVAPVEYLPAEFRPYPLDEASVREARAWLSAHVGTVAEAQNYYATIHSYIPLEWYAGKPQPSGFLRKLMTAGEDARQVLRCVDVLVRAERLTPAQALVAHLSLDAETQHYRVYSPLEDYPLESVRGHETATASLPYQTAIRRAANVVKSMFEAEQDITLEQFKSTLLTVHFNGSISAQGEAITDPRGLGFSGFREDGLVHRSLNGLNFYKSVVELLQIYRQETGLRLPLPGVDRQRVEFLDPELLRLTRALHKWTLPYFANNGAELFEWNKVFEFGEVSAEAHLGHLYPPPQALDAHLRMALPSLNRVRRLIQANVGGQPDQTALRGVLKNDLGELGWWLADSAPFPDGTGNWGKLFPFIAVPLHLLGFQALSSSALDFFLMLADKVRDGQSVMGAWLDGSLVKLINRYRDEPITAPILRYRAVGSQILGLP